MRVEGILPASTFQAEQNRLANRGAVFHAAMKNWLRGLDSNQDNQLQRLACYQLHYPGNAKHFTSLSRALAEKFAQKAYRSVSEPGVCCAVVNLLVF